jgi:hypothetical protein
VNVVNTQQSLCLTPIRFVANDEDVTSLAVKARAEHRLDNF